ncbi:mesogenin-1 [Bombina bombina]|uniref:mesogenin-1 n=1 Tax=Bombina bombina TaxID=8345 RepID=UPI00235A599C|nr:mesogenin-1 [Bombina bombina]
METMHQSIIKVEEDYALSSDSDPDSAFLSNSWGWKHSVNGYSLSYTPSPQSVSPAVSPAISYESSSASAGLDEVPYRGEMVTYSLMHYPDHYQHETEGTKAGHRRGHKAEMSTHRRRKASEREKMRMRAIADALHTLRNNLPPIYSQGRQPLTKIQTLKSTISYIAELTNILNSST